jgi:SH3 domain
MVVTQIIDATKAWRDSWSSILSYQHRLVNEFEGMYAPIVGAADSYHGHQPVDTPEGTMARTVRLREEYEELKKDLMEEVNMVEEKMIKPAMDAKDSLSLMKKTIKKREDRKVQVAQFLNWLWKLTIIQLDFERYQGRVEAGRKKTKRSDRENTALSKAESDFARATEEYNAADDNLRHYLPRLITVVFSLLPHLLASQIQIQNTLLAHYYTMLHTYCSEENFPNPSPPMDEVVRSWDDNFKSIQREAESIAILANGKAVRMPMKLEDSNGALNGYNRRPSGQSSLNRVPSTSPARALPPPSPSLDHRPKIAALPSPGTSLILSPPADTTVSSPSPSDYHTPQAFSPAATRADYFSRDRQYSNTSAASSMANLHATIAGKKKPPPPPPRIPSSHVVFVTALYDFGGQGEGDLVFREGDRIKVIKKTESTDDWWQGELRGVKGSFPANYCQ